jgi:hypothetical protein
LTNDEKDRLVEILFYMFFDTKDSEQLSDRNFWTAINSICQMYNIDSVNITKAVRALMAEDNQPQEDEIYYLLHSIGLTVRPIRRLSGIYWQKQKAIEDKLSKNPITIKRKINDIVVKRNMRDFLIAMYKLFGCLSDIDCETFEKYV